MIMNSNILLKCAKDIPCTCGHNLSKKAMKMNWT